MLILAETTAGAAAIVSTVIYEREMLLAGVTGFALTMTALGMGLATMALLLGRFSGRNEAGSFNPAALHDKRHRWTGCALLSSGALLTLIAISSSPLLAKRTRESERRRAYATHFSWIHAFWLITYPAIGYGTSTVGAPLTFSNAGVVSLGIAALSLLLRPASNRADHVH